jgi:hypothetical protein
MTVKTVRKRVNGLTLTSTASGCWRLEANADVLFMKLATYRGGFAGRRYTGQTWSVPGTSKTAGSLVGAVRMFHHEVAHALCKAFATLKGS